jgi:SAM-dependent methyltransferase
MTVGEAGNTALAMGCPVCGGGSVVSRGVFSSYPGELLDCFSCGSAWTHPLPSPEYLASYYQGFRFQARKKASLAQRIEAMRMDRKVHRIRRLLAKYGCSPTSILDYGGGGGAYALGFMRVFPRSQVTLFDLDSSEFHELEAGGVRPVSAVHGSFDFVFSSHVIEHVRSPLEFMKTLHAALNPGGIAIVALPNRYCREFWRPGYLLAYKRRLQGSTWGGFLSRPWFCIDPPRHLWAFSRESLDVLAKGSGFAIAEAGTEFAGVSALESNDMYALSSLGLLKRPWRLARNLFVILSSSLARVFAGAHSGAGNNLYVVLRK